MTAKHIFKIENYDPNTPQLDDSETPEKPEPVPDI
jgi:hypothetical protein